MKSMFPRRQPPHESSPGISDVRTATIAAYNAWERGETTIVPLAATEVPSEELICQLMEQQHCVKRLMTLAERAGGCEEQESIVRAQSFGRVALLSSEIEKLPAGRFMSLSEKQAVRQLYTSLSEYYKAAIDLYGAISSSARQLADITEHLNYIGQAEFAEAAAGIAAYWKRRLQEHPERQLGILVGDMKDTIYAAPDRKAKSDEYLMDAIMGYFSDEELQRYSKQLLFGKQEVRYADLAQLDVVLLDDWISTGTEMSERYRTFVSEYPQLASRIEVQLVIANEERLAVGFHPPRINSKEMPLVPTRAYFIANGEWAAWNTFLAGSHSSDYTTVRTIADLGQRVGYDQLPTGLQVARPYHDDSYKPVFYRRIDEARRVAGNMVK